MAAGGRIGMEKHMKQIEYTERMNGMIDVMKVVLALIVVGSHTAVFGFNIWLDRCYGIVSRVSVPFFFITSAYFYWLKEKGAWRFLKRILLLYVIWCVIYLPFDWDRVRGMSLWENLVFYIWRGNTHALWYLNASAIGFLITYLLLKLLRPKTVLVIGFVFLLIGCLKSTWSPLLERLLHVRIEDWLESRNGLFYAFPYTALGMFIAKRPGQGKNLRIKRCAFFTVLFFLAFVAECLVFVVLLKTQNTVLWVCMFPYAGCLFLLVNNLRLSIPKQLSLRLRKISTLIFVSHGLFLILFTKLGLRHILLFLAVGASATAFSLLILRLSKIKGLKWLEYIY